MRRRLPVPGPTFGWAGDSRVRQALAWMLRSAIIVLAAVAAYVILVYVLVPLLLRG